MGKIYNQIQEKLKIAEDTKQQLITQQQSLGDDESIKRHLETQETIIADNKKILEAYAASRENILKLRQLRDLLEAEKDVAIITETTTAIEKEEQTLQENRALLSEELQQELREEILKEVENEKKEETPSRNYEQEVADINKELATHRKTLKELQAKIDEANAKYFAVYQEEQARFAELERTNSSESFDDFVEEYLSKMENVMTKNDYEKAKADLERAKRKIKELEKQRRDVRKAQNIEIEEVRLVERAKKLNVTVEAYRRISEAVSKRSVYSKVLEKQGLGEILHKQGGRTKEERQRIEQAKEEIVTRLVEEEIKQQKEINIKETIDILYDTEFRLRQTGKPRKVNMTPAAMENVTANIEKTPKKLVKDPTYKAEYIPLKGPQDVMLGLPAGQQILALPAAKEEKRIYTAADYKMTQEAFDDYIAQGFEPGTDDFNSAVILDGTGVVPSVEVPAITTPLPEKKEEKQTGLVPVPAVKNEIAVVPQKKELPAVVQPKQDKNVVVNQTPVTNNQTNKPVQTTKPAVITPQTKQPVSKTVTSTIQRPTLTPVVIPKPQQKTVTTQATKTPVVTPKTQTPVTKTQQAAPTTKTPVTTTPTVQTKPKQSTNLYRVIQKITKDLQVKDKDAKVYRAANIKVAEGFKNELKSGNYLYNIVHLAPAIVKAPIQFLVKLSGRLRYGKKSKKRIETMKKRIEALTEDELNVLIEEYRGGRIVQENFPTVINVLIEERIKNHIMAKVTAINTQLENDYAYVFATIKTLEETNRKLNDKNLTSVERVRLLTSKKQIVSGASTVVARIRENYTEAQQLLSGGLHGISQDMKAASTKLSIVGKRFAKRPDLDHELLARQADLKDAENKAIETGNDEMALRIFVESEKLLSQETNIQGSIFGKRSTGKKYYSPLAERLDYRDDPFIRDLFTTVALTSAAYNAINTFKANGIQTEIDEANKQLAEAQNLVDTIKGKQQTFREGMESQAVQNSTNITGQVERGSLDATNWALGTSKYNTADNAGHAFYNQIYNDTQVGIGNITQQYASGAITQAQALEMMRDLANQSQTTLGNVSDQCLQVFTDYAKTHPQFDLTAVTEGVRYITQHPDAISQMNNAVVDISNMAEGLTFTQIQALKQLPDNMLVSLIGAASVAALTGNLSNTMEENVRTGKYGNSVTKMVDEYAQSQEQANNQQTYTK